MGSNHEESLNKKWRASNLGQGGVLVLTGPTVDSNQAKCPKTIGVGLPCSRTGTGPNVDSNPEESVKTNCRESNVGQGGVWGPTGPNVDSNHEESLNKKGKSGAWGLTGPNADSNHEES